MLFTEFNFIVFFIPVFIFTWLLKKNNHRILFLVFSSFIFYGMWDWKFTSLLFLIILVSYFIPLLVLKHKKYRKKILILGIIIDLAVLGFFKYFNFFIESCMEFSILCGVKANLSTLNIILPVGISFYIFQSISYMVDIYRRPEYIDRSFLNVALYISFFPQLVAGPVVRSQEFLPQIYKLPKFREIPFKYCGFLFLAGFFKKTILADNISYIIDPVFLNYQNYTGADLLFSSVGYFIQIYCDFSGYTDMAIACSLLLGYKLPKNFDFPYFSRNISIFWSRWHMSLSSWLKDYLYIPLGGNRNGVILQYKNLLITMGLGGLWHGASWNFIIWGLLHGLALVIHKIILNSRFRNLFPGAKNILNMLSITFTMLFVLIMWVFFRASTLQDAISIIQNISYKNSLTILNSYLAISLVICVVVLHYLGYKKFWRRLGNILPNWLLSIVYGVAWALMFPFAREGYQAFIYFQF